ncbi:hypothetical protein ABPG72_017457 [Tetrahymena utriculariae]
MSMIQDKSFFTIYSLSNIHLSQLCLKTKDLKWVKSFRQKRLSQRGIREISLKSGFKQIKQKKITNRKIIAENLFKGNREIQSELYEVLSYPNTKTDITKTEQGNEKTTQNNLVNDIRNRFC